MNTYVRPLNGGLVERARVSPTPLQADISVVMVVYRTGPVLAESIADVLAEPLVDEFILIDNGSSREEEAVQDAAAARDPRVRILRGHGNVGFARGCNMGAQASHGRLLVVLNPDALLQPGCVAALAEAVDATPAPRLIGARILNVDGTEQRGARRGEVTPVTTLLSLTRLSHANRFLERFEIHHEHDPEPGQLSPIQTISGACFAMSRDDFWAMGGFDEGYFLHVEDVDLCWRLRRSGGQVLFAPLARVVHLGSTSRTSPVKVEFFKGLGLVRYFRKRADNPWRVLLAYALAPLIMAVSVVRPAMRRRSRFRTT
jgi:N-acetylglucosaminyl-diphospho-decaprenol L-rhamnosyltransferase